MTKQEKTTQEKKLNSLLELVKTTVETEKDEETKKDLINYMNTRIFLYNVGRHSYEVMIALMTKILVKYDVDFDKIAKILDDK